MIKDMVQEVLSKADIDPDCNRGPRAPDETVRSSLVDTPRDTKQIDAHVRPPTTSNHLLERVLFLGRADIPPQEIACLKEVPFSPMIRLSPPRWKAILMSSFVTRVTAILGDGKVAIGEPLDAIILKCPPLLAQLLSHELSSSNPSIKVIEDYLACHKCGDFTRASILASCEHIVCRDCLNHQIWHVLASHSVEKFPISCSKPGCQKVVALPDLRKLLTSERWEALQNMAVQRHMDKLPGQYSVCRSEGCGFVYSLTDVPTISTCPKCLTQTCTFERCGKDPHPGWDCRSNWVCYRAYTIWSMLVHLLTDSVLRFCSDVSSMRHTPHGVGA